MENTGDGTARWASFNTSWASSARAELGAMLLMLLREGPTHIGLDKKSVWQKAELLMEHAASRLLKYQLEISESQEGKPHHGSMKYDDIDRITASSPLKKPWLLKKGRRFSSPPSFLLRLA